ncbi:MAG: DUF1232 domain-containing protein [Anaerolineae bacterium]|nr:DUF1232 domain-containing protein [Anaerolineae bacterium]
MTKKPSTVTNDKDYSFLSNLLKQLRLVWLLFTDSRIGLLAKSVVPLSLLYTISPVDFIPDVILGLGQLDDFGVILLGMTLFIKLCPPHIVEQYSRMLDYGSDAHTDFDNDETVDASYRVVNED